MKYNLYLSLLIILLIIACGFPFGSPDSQEPTEEPPTGQPGLPTEIPIVHLTRPGELPPERANHAGDSDSSSTAAKKYPPSGDRFTFGKFERPFVENTMDTYFPDLDIVDTFIYQDEEWAYGVIALQSPGSSGNLSGKYAIEIDLNIDGRGDWLVIASQPTSPDWAVEGVQVYHDANQDVGGSVAMRSDYDMPGDGFEDLVFDSGVGADPDLAWGRVASSDPPAVELAIKRTVFENVHRYMVNMWAGSSDLDPALFDFNDHLTHEQAGAADPGFEIFYPIKELSEIDNTCKMAVGFEPVGNEPGLCETLIPKVPGATSVPGGCQPPVGGCPPVHHWDPILCECKEDPPGPIN